VYLICMPGLVFLFSTFFHAAFAAVLCLCRIRMLFPRAVFLILFPVQLSTFRTSRHHALWLCSHRTLVYKRPSVILQHTHCITYPNNTCSQRVSAVSVSLVVKLTSAQLKEFRVQLQYVRSFRSAYHIQSSVIHIRCTRFKMRPLFLARSDCCIRSAVFDTAE
jgi:hypothetical protein